MSEQVEDSAELRAYKAAQLDMLATCFPKMILRLKSEGVASFIVSFSGAGDSGQIDDVSCFDKDDKPVAVSDGVTTLVQTFGYALLNKYEHKHDWWNNDGGQGRVSLNIVEGTLETYIGVNRTEVDEFNYEGIPDNLTEADFK